MLCQKCGKKEATTHIKKNVNGQITEFHLCSECAFESGYGNIFKSIGINDMISSFFGDAAPKPALSGEVKRCPKCGMTFSDIVKTGCCGCAECYSYFYQELLPSLRRIHGKAQHVGKISESASPEAKKRGILDKLKIDIDKAVAEQRFEDAAKLRDNIRELEGEDAQ